MAGQTVHPVEFEAQAPAVFACFKCGRLPARRTRFCPYCAEEQFSPLAAAPPADAANDEKIIHAEFGVPRKEAEPPAVPEPEPAKPAVAPVVPQQPVPTPAAAAAPAAGKPAPAAPKPAKPFVAKPATPPPLVARVKTRRSQLPWIIAALVIGGIVLSRSLPGPRNAADNAATQGTGTVTLYALRGDVSVRDQPSTTGSNKIATLGRGDPVQGEWQTVNAAGARWFKITQGSFSGDYVWGGNFAPSAPETLATIVNAELRTNAATMVYASPDDGATVVDTIRARHTAFVTGSLSSGWFELRLKHGGVGYAHPDNFDQ